jgi:hypothetical protein
VREVSRSKRLSFQHLTNGDGGANMKRVGRKGSVLVAAVLTMGLLVGGLGGSAQAEFPYPTPTSPPSDPYDYGSYMKTKSTDRDDMPDELTDNIGDNDWKYSSKTACDLYGPDSPNQKFFNCSPATVANPQEQHGVTGSSVDRAWTYTTGRPDTVIAVHDSGIQWNSLSKPMIDVNNKTWLNFGELPVPGATTFSANKRDYDVNHDGIFNIKDYCQDWLDEKDCGGTGDSRVRGDAASADTDYNRNGIIDPEELIFIFSDGIDQDGNGYTDDFVGWDTYEDDNDPFDEVQYGHGSGEAGDSTAEANNEGNGGGGDVGSCPNCMVMHMRVGDSFVADVNDAAEGMIYATDNGADILQSALGTLNNSRFAQEAIDYAYRKGVVLIASAADESAGHHNQPSVLEHAVTFNSIGEPSVEGAGQPPSYLEFRGCTNYGAYIAASVPSNSCSSEAVGRMAGVAGLMYSAAKNRLTRNGANGVVGGTLGDYGALDGPGGVPEGRVLSAEEVDQLVARGADDINFTSPLPYTDRSYPETQRYGATKGWDPFFGYGRINARRMVRAIEENKIPPEADITSPKWFDIVDPTANPATAPPIEIEGTVASRRTPKYDYEVQWGLWSWYEIDRKNYQPPVYHSSNDPASGITLTNPGNQSAPISGVLATIDPEVIAAELEAERDGTQGPAVDPTTGRGDHENRQLPDKFSVVVRVIVTAKNQNNTDVLQDVYGEVDDPNGGTDPVTGSDPNKDQAAATVPLRGVGTKQFFVHHDPALFNGFPRDLQGDGAAAPRFADIDNDGVDEIIVATSNGLIHAYESAGGEVPGWPVHTTDAALNYDAPAYQSGEITTPVYSAVLRSPAVGDLDRDGDLEVVSGDFQGRIWAWDHTGKVVRGFPVRSNPAFSTPDPSDRAAGFYDDHPELVEGHWQGPGSIPNDPDLVPDLVNRHTQLNRLNRWFLPSPTLANIDAETDDLEILAGAADRHLYAFDSRGGTVPGWPVFLRDNLYLQRVDPDTHEITNIRDAADYDEDRDTDEVAQKYNGAKVVTSPAAGNLDGDVAGTVEVLSTVNEQYREIPNFDDPTLRGICNDPPDPLKPHDPTGEFPEADPVIDCGNDRLYAMSGEGRRRVAGGPDADTGHPNSDDFLPGWPAPIGTVYLELLPVVGNGPDGSPILGQVSTANPGLETGIFATAGPGYILKQNGRSLYGQNADGRDRVLLTDALGPGSNSPDAPSIPAVGGAIYTEIQDGKLSFAAPGAGLGKLLDVALPDDQLQSDNQLAVWETSGTEQAAPRNQIAGFPREVNDLQFLTTPSAADIDGTGAEEILEGSAYYDLHAFTTDGTEPGANDLAPDGWPKFTGGWTVSPPAVGDWDGDGKRDIAHVIREGRFFVWKSNGAEVCDPATWPEWGHDGWMTNNTETDAIRPRVINDLSVTSNADGTATLTWKAPGDDGICGKAKMYDVRRSNRPLTTDDFSFGRPVNADGGAAPPEPGEPGTTQTYVIQREQCNSYVAVQTYDGNPATDQPAHPANPSAASNSVEIPGTDPTSTACGGPGGTSPVEPTRLTISGARSGQTTDRTELRALLETPSGPVSGEPVTFTFQGRSFGATTDAAGIAVADVKIRGKAKSTSIAVEFTGTSLLEPSSDTELFVVQREDSRMKVRFRRAHPGTAIRARLRDLDSPLAVAGRMIRFFLNGEPVGRRRTDSEGRAKVILRGHRLKRGDKARVAFVGGNRFRPSSGTTRWRRR